MKFIAALILGVMIGPGVWRVAQRFNPRMSPGYVIGVVIAAAAGEAHHLAAQSQKPAECQSPEGRKQ
jgi:hypothetical protein